MRVSVGERPPFSKAVFEFPSSLAGRGGFKQEPKWPCPRLISIFCLLSWKRLEFPFLQTCPLTGSVSFLSYATQAHLLQSDASSFRRIAETFPLPGSVDGLTRTAENLLLEIESRRARESVTRVLVFRNLRSDESSAEPKVTQLLPLDRNWLRRLADRPWPSRARPAYTMDGEAVFGALVRQHLFIALFHAGAESAASEHSTRLMAMQAAERNIEERLEDMNTDYRRLRQDSITAELLDVVAGFEALSSDPAG